MPHIRLDDKEVELSVGELGIGTDDRNGVRFDTGRGAGTLAVLVVDSRGTVTVRRAAADAKVLVNGVALGEEPAPLLHGDRIEVAGRQLRFSDDRKAGSTVLVPALDVGMPRVARAPSDTRRPATGGRFVSLTDGREYAVPPNGLRIGRDATCDIVVPGEDVSRQHAEVSAGPNGYVLRDLSTNGVFVNAARAGNAHLLRRGDVVRIGSEEFRFYADEPAMAAQAAVASPGPAGAPAEAPVPPTLASLEVINEGPRKGTRYAIRSPLAHVGRGQHNDIVLTDESVSDTHAKIQRRDSGWFVVDMGSTNGTYVSGTRVRGEHPLTDGVSVRFGGVKVIFRPEPDGIVADGGTRVFVGLEPPAHQPARARDAVEGRASDTHDPETASRGSIALLWVAAAAIIGATIFFLTQDP